MKKLTQTKMLLIEVPKVLAKQGELHYLKLSELFNVSPATMGWVLLRLKRQGIIDNPYMTLRVRRAGYYTITK